MKALRLLAITLITSLAFQSKAQQGIELGARPSAMGNAHSALSGNWSAFNNPAGLATLSKITTVFAINNNYGIQDLSSVGAGVILPVRLGTTSITAFRFGDDLFHQQHISLSYANQFGIGQLGLRINYVETFIEDFGSRGVMSMDFGGIVSIGKELSLGAFVRNVNRAKLSEFEDERLPTLLNLGLSYRSSEKLTVNMDVEKDIDFDPRFKLGIEYLFLPKFSFRTGVNTAPLVNFFGLGFKTWKVEIDYAIGIDYTLGNSHQVSLTYSLSKK